VVGPFCPAKLGDGNMGVKGEKRKEGVHELGGKKKHSIWRIKDTGKRRREIVDSGPLISKGNQFS